MRRLAHAFATIASLLMGRSTFVWPSSRGGGKTGTRLDESVVRRSRRDIYVQSGKLVEKALTMKNMKGNEEHECSVISDSNELAGQLDR